MNFQNKKFYFIGLMAVLAGVFLVGASSVSAAGLPADLSAKALASAEALAKAGCGENNGGLRISSLASIFNPLLDFAEKVVKDFGYDVVLAASPDPDTCGSDSVGCSGVNPTATVNWTAAPRTAVIYGLTNCDVSCHYIVTINGIGNSPQINYNTTSYTVSSGLANNTTYGWSVEAYYQTYQSWRNGLGQCIYSSASCGYTNQPYGSFTAPNCAPTCTPGCGACSVYCGGGTQTCTRADCSTYTQSCNTQPCADFSLNSSNNIYATLVQGQDGDSSATTLTILPFYGFSSTINLSVQSVSPSLPSGSTYHFSDSSLSSSEYSAGSQFYVHIGGGLVASQTYTITIRGQDGGLIRTVNVLLNVQVKNPTWREI